MGGVYCVSGEYALGVGCGSILVGLHWNGSHWCVYIYIFLCFEDSVSGESGSYFAPLFFPFCFLVLKLWHTLFQWGILFWAALDILILFSLTTSALAINSCILCCCKMTCLLVCGPHRKGHCLQWWNGSAVLRSVDLILQRKKQNAYEIKFYMLINFNLFSSCCYYWYSLPFYIRAWISLT